MDGPGHEGRRGERCPGGDLSLVLGVSTLMMINSVVYIKGVYSTIHPMYSMVR